MFINCKKALEFTNPEGGKFTVPQNYIGSVPNWVTKTWLYKAACSDGTITFIGSPQNEQDSEDEELTELRELAKEQGIKNFQNMKKNTLQKKIEEAQKNKKNEDKKEMPENGQVNSGDGNSNSEVTP